MGHSSVKFGTSGLRGLATELSDGLAAAHAQAFAQYLAQGDTGNGPREIYVASDLRSSGALIKSQVVAGLLAGGMVPVDCGCVPTPALAHAAMERSLPSIMVTGSHIAADRNGLKFFTSAGEITKADEASIVALAEQCIGPPTGSSAVAQIAEGVGAAFLRRYERCFPAGSLRGLRVGVYEHSTVIRDLLAECLERCGADVVRLGRSDSFVALDTESIGREMRLQFKQWCVLHKLDALVSADGDGDRPLIADESGTLVNGDVVGLITTQFLRAQTAVTPITSNSGIERHLTSPVVRTKVGSPHVIAGMEAAIAQGFSPVVGFEANGGFLLGSNVSIGGFMLSALPTRDAILPILAVLSTSAHQDSALSKVISGLGLPFTASQKLEDVSSDKSIALFHKLYCEPDCMTSFFKSFGTISAVDNSDGLRAIFSSGAIIHLRASGNEPALRFYVEAPSELEAHSLLRDICLLIDCC